jgi:hypothetical protein
MVYCINLILYLRTVFDTRCSLCMFRSYIERGEVRTNIFSHRKPIVPRSCPGLFTPISSGSFSSPSFIYLTFSSRDSSILPEELATQSVRLKEEQLRKEEEKVGFPLMLIPAYSPMYISAPRNRAQSPTRDQREEAGAFGQRGVSQVRVVY